MIKNWRNKVRIRTLVIVAAFVLNIALWGSVLFTFPSDSPAAVLHYSVGVGVDFIGEGKQIMMLPIAGTVLLALNLLFAYILRRVNVAAGWMLIGTSALLQAIFLAAYFYILALNQ